MPKGGDNRSVEEKELSAAMDADIVDLRRDGVSFKDIGALVVEKYGRVDGGDGPYARQSMHRRWCNVVARVPAKKVEEHRAELNERLETLLEQVEDIASRTHYAHSNGQVVKLNGQPLLDDGPNLAARTELRKLLTEIRQLNGLTVPVKQELNLGGSVSYTINGVDPEKLK